MPVYEGPCEDCGQPLIRNIRKGRAKIHVECGIARSERQNREYADPASAPNRRAKRQGEDMRRQWHTGKGVWYEKTLKGWARMVETRSAMMSRQSDTLPAEQPPPKRGNTRRQ